MSVRLGVFSSSQEREGEVGEQIPSQFPPSQPPNNAPAMLWSTQTRTGRGIQAATRVKYRGCKE